MKKVKSHSLVIKDFSTLWYRRWARQLKQDSGHLDGNMLRANKFWQNASICQALYERGCLQAGKSGIGFGVGQERLPAIFARYDVQVMATDQDFRTKKAGHWAEHELAEGLQSLNKFDIVEGKKFTEQVSFQAADMKKPFTSFTGQYDFAWSNCALGHLGSIPEGLKFIEKTLACLKPGGFSVHTTELNVLSNDETVTGGDTVIFRLKDIYELYQKLTKEGYICEPLHFTLGHTKADLRVSLQPKYGNDFSKIQVGHHLATQVILIIQKPLQKPSPKAVQKTLKALNKAYQQALNESVRFAHRSPAVRQILKSQAASAEDFRLVPLQQEQKIEIKQGHSKTIRIAYKNKSDVCLYSVYGYLTGSKPIVLGTVEPTDRTSPFADTSWVAGSKNRISSDLQILQHGVYHATDRVEPGQKFIFKATFNAEQLMPGQYQEKFAVVLEDSHWIPETTITVDVKVV